MIIENAKYIKTIRDDTHTGIVATLEGKESIVPLDLNNRHYIEILKQVDEGTITIAEAD
jgi:hypothetical protein